MAVAVTYPGVYIEEVPSGVRTITSVGTSVTAFADFFREGPMDRAVEVFGMADFTRVFGGLDDRSEASYAISQFFVNGGSSALVIRCASSSVANPLAAASVGIAAGTAAATAVMTVTAANPGAWGNGLRIDIDAATTDPARYFNLTINRHASDAAAAPVVAQERFLNLTLDEADTRYAPDVVNPDSKLVVLDVPAVTTSVPLAGGTTSGALALNQAALDGLGTAPAKRLLVRGGASGSFYEATLPTWAAGAVVGLAQLASRLETAIRTAVDSSGAGVPTPPALTGATVAVVGILAGNRLAVRAGRGDPDRDFLDVIGFQDAAGPADTTVTDLLLTAAATGNAQRYVLGSGEADDPAYVQGDAGGDGLPPDADALVGAVADANDRGIYALRKADLFNLLCLPRAAAIVPETNGEAQMTQIVSRAIQFCGQSRAFFMLDIPATVNDVSEMKDWLDVHAAFRSRNAAVFFPRLRIPDPMNGFRLRSVGCSGTMAGLFARTDSERGVWKAPAGIEAVLRGLSGMDLKLTDAENGVLNPLGINCLRVFPIYGSVSWGARTLDGADQAASEWKYTPIRRLALMLEESLFRGTKWVVFEPNDEPLWARIRLNLGAYMMGLFRQGAFQGASPKDAFYVKCDGETTTQADRNLGIVNIQVGFAPLKPAEFVVIRIQQIAGDL